MNIFKEIWFEILLICIYVGVVGYFNEKVATLITICLLFSLMSFIIKDGKQKLIMTTIINIIIVLASILYVKYNVKAQEVMYIIFYQYTWLVWFCCATINNLLVSKLCVNKVFVDKLSCIMGYIGALIIGFYISMYLSILFHIENVQDKSQEINFITAFFILFYTLLQALIFTKDELWLLLFWEYELDDENNRVVLIKSKISKRKYKIKSKYVIGNRKMKTYLAYGAFAENKIVEEVTFETGVKVKEQSILWLFGENSNLNKVVGLTKDISCNYQYRKFLPNLKSIEWTLLE